jgi:hypothetical protein
MLGLGMVDRVWSRTDSDVDGTFTVQLPPHHEASLTVRLDLHLGHGPVHVCGP